MPNEPTTPLEARKARLKGLLPNCGFLFEIEDVIYSGTPKQRHPVTQDEYLALMNDLYALVPTIDAQARELAALRAQMPVVAPELKEKIEQLDRDVKAVVPDGHWVQNHHDKSVWHEFVPWHEFQELASQVAEVMAQVEKENTDG